MTVSTLPLSTTAAADSSRLFYPPNPIQTFFESLVPVRAAKPLEEQRAELEKLVDLKHMPPLQDEYIPSVHALVTEGYAQEFPFTRGKNSAATAQLANPRKVALTNAHVVGALTTLVLSALSGDPVTSLVLGSAAGSVIAPISYLGQDWTNKNVLTEIAQAKPSENQSGLLNLHDIGRAPNVLEFAKDAIGAVTDYGKGVWNNAGEAATKLFFQNALVRGTGKGVEEGPKEAIKERVKNKVQKEITKVFPVSSEVV